MVTILLKSIYYQFRIFTRIKTAFFLLWIFPLFLLLIFGNLWGSDSNYIPFILTGVVAMTITSDGLYSIGPVVKEYYANGLIRYLKKLPIGVPLYFLAYIISRVISQFIVVIILCISSYVFFGYNVSFNMILRIFIAIIIGLILFAFLGLTISSFSIKNLGSNGIISIIGYSIIFTSNTFYPVGQLSKSIEIIGNILPLNPILAIMRAESVDWINILLWLSISIICFIFRLKRIKFRR